MLRDAAQVDLDPDYAKRSKADLTAAAKKIVDDSKDDADAFRSLKKTGLISRDCHFLWVKIARSRKAKPRL